MFDEKKLRQDIADRFGEYGAHVELFDMIMKENKNLKTKLEAMNGASAKPTNNGDTLNIREDEKDMKPTQDQYCVDCEFHWFGRYAHKHYCAKCGKTDPVTGVFSFKPCPEARGGEGCSFEKKEEPVSIWKRILGLFS